MAVRLHVVLTTFYEHVPQLKRETLRLRMAALGEACGGRTAGILYWHADRNLDLRKGYHLMEFGVFADDAAFRRFRAHPAHLEFAEALGRVADWVVGDLMADIPL